MARVGFRLAKYNEIDSTTKKYKALVSNKVPDFEKVVDESFSPEFNSAELYANDALQESDYSFNKGSLTITIAHDDDAFLAKLFGNTISDGEVTRKIDDTIPEMGYGHIIPMIVGGSNKYKVEFFPRVKFSSITGDNKTRADSVEFSTSQVTGTVFPLAETINGLAAGTWEKHQTFDTLTAAEEYLDELLTPAASV